MQNHRFGNVEKSVDCLAFDEVSSYSKLFVTSLGVLSLLYEMIDPFTIVVNSEFKEYGA